MVEDLAARSADAVRALARRTGRPEVVALAHPRDAIQSQADVLLPDPGGLVVVQIDGDRQAAGIDAQPLLAGQELPGPVDRFAFEVIAKAEIAQHLEERVVISRPADVVDIAGAQALLARRRAGVGQLDLAQKVVLELVHPGGREQHRGIPSRDQHVAGLAAMALGLEERQVSFAEFVGFHGRRGQGVRARVLSVTSYPPDRVCTCPAVEEVAAASSATVLGAEPAAEPSSGAWGRAARHEWRAPSFGLRGLAALDPGHPNAWCWRRAVLIAMRCCHAHNRRADASRSPRHMRLPVTEP